MKQIFPDYIENKTYNGVDFRAITDKDSWHSSLRGISIESGSWDNRLRRRVMIEKNNKTKIETIDDDKIKAKYLEAKVHTDKDTERLKLRDELLQHIDDKYNDLIKELGIKDWVISKESETNVKIWGNINWLQLQNISAELNRDITVHLEVSVSYEQAKNIYKIFHPEYNKTLKDVKPDE
jgi:hypothetical protein